MKSITKLLVSPTRFGLSLLVGAIAGKVRDSSWGGSSTDSIGKKIGKIGKFGKSGKFGKNIGTKTGKKENTMKRAMTLATGLAVGYVAGAHAGRERYEQIKQKAHDISQQPAVADARESLREHATAATKTVAGKVTDVTSGLAHKLHSSNDDEDHSFPSDPAVTADATATQPLNGTGKPSTGPVM
jgi:hypothetical protein